MTEENKRTSLILSSCVLEMNRAANEYLNMSWAQVCLASAVKMCEDEETPCTASKLADMTGIPRTTTTRILDKMIEAGWFDKKDEDPYPVYFCKTDEEQQIQLDKFINLFKAYVITTAHKINSV